MPDDDRRLTAGVDRRHDGVYLVLEAGVIPAVALARQRHRPGVMAAGMQLRHHLVPG